jgi:lipoprotein-anchoring transpeptidase ErfK/SrfK
MSNSSIDGKTIRPGSLNGYSYYYSQRRPTAPPIPKKSARLKLRPRKGMMYALLVIIVAALSFMHQGRQDPQSAGQPPPQAAAVTPDVTVNHCAGNPLAKLIKISIDQRRLWACEGSKTVHNAPVITGLKHHAETETPLGTYKVYAKQTNTKLTGTDSRGSWSDPVYYWMPFLDNQYGTYGFHDATWRADDAFGKISPESNDASHGCVELPLASSKWLYDWAPVGTTVSVEG